VGFGVGMIVRYERVGPSVRVHVREYGTTLTFGGRGTDRRCGGGQSCDGGPRVGASERGKVMDCARDRCWREWWGKAASRRCSGCESPGGLTRRVHWLMSGKGLRGLTGGSICTQGCGCLSVCPEVSGGGEGSRGESELIVMVIKYVMIWRCRCRGEGWRLGGRRGRSGHVVSRAVGVEHKATVVAAEVGGHAGG